MQPTERFAHIIPAFLDLVRELDDDELALPTPCTDWTVGDLLEHVTAGALTFAGALRGDAPRGDPRDVRKTIADALPEFERALEAPGAFGRTIGGLPFGEMTGETLGHYAAFDLLMHAWDLSMALGRRIDVSEALIADVESWARGWLIDAYRRPGMFGPATRPGAGASRLDRLVAFSGRDLAWTSAP